MSYDIELLADAIVSRIKPAIPLSVDLWSVEEIALYLKRSRATVRDQVVFLPRFPAAIRIPVLSGKTDGVATIRKGKGHSLWKAEEVIIWANSHQDRRRQ